MRQLQQGSDFFFEKKKQRTFVPLGFGLGTALLAASLACVLPADAGFAQSNPGWFVPAQPAAPTARQAAASPRGRRQPAVAPAPLPAPLPEAEPPPEGDAQQQEPMPNLPQPPVPALPDLVAPAYSALSTGDAVKVTATGNAAALPAPLDAATTYYVIKGPANTVTLAASASDATAGTAVNLTSAGSGILKLASVSRPTPTSGEFTVKGDSLHLLTGGSVPPTAIIGVLGVPDVMRASSAAQVTEKVIGARKEKLRADVERAQATWRELEQQLQNEAPKLTPEQGRAKERALRDRVYADRRALQDRNRIIQEAGQVALGQIERTLIAIIRQVADSRGMNLVLHRSQVALNVQEFDITAAVVEQLNRTLPTVLIPPENVDPATLPHDWGSGGISTAAAPAPSVTR
jgi:Skp family chaperone for outer membrane proteins